MCSFIYKVDKKLLSIIYNNILKNKNNNKLHYTTQLMNSYKKVKIGEHYETIDFDLNNNKGQSNS